MNIIFVFYRKGWLFFAGASQFMLS